MLVKFFSIIILFSDFLFPCAVCYGNPDSPMSHGMSMGVLTLMGFIGFILFVVLFSICSISNRKKLITHKEKYD